VRSLTPACMRKQLLEPMCTLSAATCHAQPSPKAVWTRAVGAHVDQATCPSDPHKAPDEIKRLCGLSQQTTNRRASCVASQAGYSSAAGSSQQTHRVECELTITLSMPRSVAGKETKLTLCEPEKVTIANKATRPRPAASPATAFENERDMSWRSLRA
jgi:hypothetical protein